MTKVDAETWTLTVSGLTASLEYKPLLDDTDWSEGPNFQIEPNGTAVIFPRFVQLNGDWSRHWPVFHSNMGNDRGVWLYLPPSYSENTAAKFPVLYMHDGQNLVSRATGRGRWAKRSTPEPTTVLLLNIVVGPVLRPIASRNTRLPLIRVTLAKADLYLRFLIEELKPVIDRDYRTLPDRDNTYLAGSSLGGLVTAYAGTKRPDVFGHIAAFSPSTWWDNTVIITDVGQMPAAPNRPITVYITVATVAPTTTTSSTRGS